MIESLMILIFLGSIVAAGVVFMATVFAAAWLLDRCLIWPIYDFIKGRK